MRLAPMSSWPTWDVWTHHVLAVLAHHRRTLPTAENSTLALRADASLDHQSVRGGVILLSVPRNPTDHIQGEERLVPNQALSAITLITEQIFLQETSF